MVHLTWRLLRHTLAVAATLYVLNSSAAQQSLVQSSATHPKPAHHGVQTYLNPHAAESTKGFFGIIRARLSRDWISYDAKRDKVPQTASELLPTNQVSTNATVTWIGHATVLVQHQGVNLLTDPMFSNIASPVSFAGPKRITQPSVSIDELPDIDAVLISHDHYDHLDTASIKALGNQPTYFVPLGIKRWLIGKGIDPQRIVELDWWQERTLNIDGVKVRLTSTPAQHFSGRSLTNTDQSLWSSWSIAWEDFRVWFGGDTGYNDIHFKEIGRRLGPFDLGIIPIGAYKPSWFMQTVHVSPLEAVWIHNDIGAAQSMGIHWGTFVLSGEGVLTPPIELAHARTEHGMDKAEFDVFAVGETRHYISTSTPPASIAEVMTSYD